MDGFCVKIVDDIFVNTCKIKNKTINLPLDSRKGYEAIDKLKRLQVEYPALYYEK
jgi:hypothetical protein